MSTTPHIVGLGGTTRPDSSSERALRFTLGHASSLGAQTTMFTGHDLAQLPHYDPKREQRGETASRLVEQLRLADGIVIASPAYHGSVSGMLKNGLDYVEDMREDSRVYFAGRSVGVIVTGYGWQAIVSTINTLRTIAHALRGWVTPLGAGIDSSGQIFDGDGGVADDKARFQLETVGEEVVSFARWRLDEDVDTAVETTEQSAALPA